MRVFSLTFFLFGLILTSCSSPRPDNLGLKEGPSHKVLNSCPESPNCIGSHYPEDKDHHLDALKYESSLNDAQKVLKGILSKTSGAKIIKETPNYWHVEFTSSIFRFIDDVEFNFSQENFIHFRSASRMGHSDLGANKKRIEEITFRFYQRDF